MYCDLASNGGVSPGSCLFSRPALEPCSSRCCKILGYAVATPVNARQRMELDFILGNLNWRVCDLETSDESRMVLKPSVLSEEVLSYTLFRVSSSPKVYHNEHPAVLAMETASTSSTTSLPASDSGLPFQMSMHSLVLLQNLAQKLRGEMYEGPV
jgi:hypothetical protein